MLAKANFQEANFQEANLQEANLGGAYLNRANLGAAMLAKANLEWAKLKCANLPFSSRAWAIVRACIKDKLPEAFVFINPSTRRPYRAKVLNTLWRTHSGFDCDYYSASRHSFCTQLVHERVNQFEAQALMRHADLRSTQKHFHADQDVLRERLEGRGKKHLPNSRMGRK